jgi:hypothetical protein
MFSKLNCPDYVFLLYPFYTALVPTLPMFIDSLLVSQLAQSFKKKNNGLKINE